MAWRAIGGVVAVALLAGCAVGPDFVRPPAPPVVDYTDPRPPERLVAGTGEPDQRIVTGAVLAAEWWELFRSPAISAGVQGAIAGNQTLAAAEANLGQVEEA